MGVSNYGTGTDKLSAPQLAAWASSVAAALNGSDTTVDSRLALAGARQIVVADHLESWGHSYAAGSGATSRGKTFSQVVARRFGVNEWNQAQAGNDLTQEGPIAKVLNDVQPLSAFAPPQLAFLVFWGINGSSSATSIVGRTQAWGNVVSRMRCASAVFDETDGSFAFTGTWAPYSPGTGAHGSVTYTTTGSDSYTVTTPADFPGGTIAVGLYSQSTIGQGAIHTATVGGTVVASVDARTTVAGTTNYHVLRVPSLAAGANVVSVALSSIAGLTAVDCWWWESPAGAGPLVMICEQPYLPDYTAFGSDRDDSDVDDLNAIIAALPAEFGDRVVVVSSHRAAMDRDADYFDVDKLHPNDLGHATIAQAVVDDVTAAGFTIMRGSDVEEPRIEYGAAAPVDSATSRYVGDRVINTVPAELGSGGSKYVVAGWVCTVAGAPGTWVALRSLTGA